MFTMWSSPPGPPAPWSRRNTRCRPAVPLWRGWWIAPLPPRQREDLTSAIPEGVTLRKWTLYNGLLTVDFTSGYGTLSGIDLTLADYSVVLTLTQLEGVETVMITVDGEMLAYRDHQRLTAEDAWVLAEAS